MTSRSGGDTAPILVGRNEAKLRSVAEPLAFQYRVFDLTNPAAINATLGEVDAGPFSVTSRPMADACLRTGTHYLDITGEIVRQPSTPRTEQQGERLQDRVTCLRSTWCQTKVSGLAHQHVRYAALFVRPSEQH